MASVRDTTAVWAPSPTRTRNLSRHGIRYAQDMQTRASSNTILTAALALLPVAGAAPAPSRAECSGVPIDVGRYFVVPAAVSGHPVRLVLDPIRNVLLDAAWADEAGIETVDSEAAGYGPNARIGGAGGEEYEPSFAVGLDLVVGDLSIPLPPVVVLDLRTPLGPSFDEVGGLLGTDLFQRRLLTIDAVNGCMTIEPRDRADRPDEEPLKIIRERNRPTVEGVITLSGGEQLSARFLVDFGMSGGVRLSTRFVDANRLADRLETSVPENRETGLGGPLRTLTATVDAVAIGGMEWRGLDIGLARETSGADADPPWDALIGVGLLRTAKVVYDPAGDRLWLLPAGGG